MKLKKCANKLLAILLAVSLACGTNMPISALANESATVDVSEVVSENSAVTEEVSVEPETVSDVAEEIVTQSENIVKDDEGKTIDLQGNSVVIDAADELTAIYEDANGDGVADSGTPYVSGDLSEYTVYGIKDTTTDKTICITVNGGTVGKLYGAYNANITAEGHGLKMFLKGGTVTNGVEVLSNATVTNMVKVVDSVGMTITDTAAQTAAGGYCKVNIEKKAHFYGNYFIDDAFSTSGHVYVHDKCRLTIESGASLFVENNQYVYLYTGSDTIVKGTLNTFSIKTNSTSYYGSLFVNGGTLTRSSNAKYLYYPVTVTKNLEQVTPSFTNSRTITENGADITFLKADGRSEATIAVPGYDCYYSLNGAEAVKSDGTALSVSVSKAATNLQLNYVPKQISVEKNSADPVAVVNTEYTLEQPLYDLGSLEITDDTTSAYGGDVVYVLKEGSALPQGLSLSGNKIVGTPKTVNSNGSKVSFVVTGRNGTQATVDVVVRVEKEGYAPKDINELVTVNGSAIDLNGTSVVVIPTSAGRNSQIYLDENHDKVPDNNISLLVDGEEQYDLNRYTIYGYRATDKAYDGDISITVKGGYLNNIYGVKGESKSSPAIVNGDVSISLESVCLNEKYSEVYGVYYGEVKNLSLSVTGGYYYYADFYGAWNSVVDGNLSYHVGDKMQVYGRSTLESVEECHKVYFYPACGSKITGSVKQELGLESSNYAITHPDECYYRGVYASEVDGDINCTTDGYWNTQKMTMVSEQSTVGGDVVLTHITGKWDEFLNTSVVENSTVTGDVKMIAQENAILPRKTLYLLSSSSAENAYIRIPESCTEFINADPYDVSDDSQIENAIYIYKKGELTVSGEYTIEEDVKAASVTIKENANVTIAENKTLDADGSLVVETGATLVNKGTVDLNITSGNSPQSSVAGCLDNYGTLVTDGMNNTDCYLSIGSDAKIMNRDNASWKVKNYIENAGKIVNYGSFVQECTDSNYDYKLGSIYSTKPLTLSRSPKDVALYYDNSTFYYGVTVNCPDYYTEGVSVTGNAVFSSGVAGDTNKYIKVVATGGTEPTFAVTPEGSVSENIKVESVTYGVGDETLGTLQESDGVWTGAAAGVLEPFVVTFHYETVDETPFIILAEDEIRIENTEEETKLIVGKSYTESNPLYDLNTLQIENTEAAGGIISCTLDRTTSLPNGFVFENGKIYGTFTTATDEDKEIRFVIKAGNDTCALFTLTLGNVKKATTSLVLPSIIETECGKTLESIPLPEVDEGEYQWLTQGIEVIKTDRICTAVFIPEDADNYDWSTIEGWNESEKRCEFSVAIKVTHKNWNAGVITKAPTTTATGVKTYTCGCGATKTETIAKLPSSGQGGTSNPSGGKPTGDSSGEGESVSVPAVGTKIKDTVSKATYKVSKAGKEVTFVKPNSKKYTKVTIPSTIKYEGVTYKVTAIANNACKSNSKLKTVKIGSNVKTIGSKAFYGCKKLTSVTIGSKVTTIGNSAFQSCTALKSFTIPSKVSKIGSKAFYGCKKLLTMKIKTSKLTEKKVGKNAFEKMGSSNYKKVKVTVPKKKVSAYKKIFKKKGLSSKAKVKK